MAIQSNFPAIKPSLNLDFSNTKRLDSRITFTRASTATYYDGVTTAKAEENLLLYSQEFENAVWGKTSSNTSVTANTTAAPDGTTTADTLTATAGGSNHYLQAASGNLKSVVSGTTYALSIHLKQGTNQYAQLAAGNASEFGLNAFLNIDLSTGTVGTVGSAVVSHNVTTLTGGWYRVELVVTAVATGANGNFIVALVTSNTATRLETWTAAGTETLILWGAQLEQRSSVTSYTATTTQPITNYVPVLLTAATNQPRFDHNPTTDESLGVLIEEQRTNLLLQSEDLDTTWAETRATLNLNSVVSPDGTLTADRLIASTDNNTHFTTQTFTGTAASYTFTAYAKASGLNFVALRLFNGTSQVGLAYYNLSTGATGTVTAGTAIITSVGNGWYRCSLTATLAASASCTADIYLASADNTNSFAGDAFNGIALWGFQTELGAFPTSYIKTVAATVTRSPDAASMIGPNFSSWYNQGEGAFYVELIPSALAAANGIVVNDNTTSNRIRLATTSTSDQCTITVTGTAQAVLDGGTPVANTTMKLAMAYQVNNFALSLGGASVATDTAGVIPVVTQLQIGAETTTIGNVRIKKAVYYPLRLTNAQLQALTG